jgi:hypothetical protein
MLKKGLLLGLIFFALNAVAQPYKTVKPYKPYKWMFGLHWSAIEDDGNTFGGIFDVMGSWNIRPFPTSLTVDRYFVYGWSAELALNYGQYNGNRLVNGVQDVSGINLSSDLHAKYSLYNLYAPSARWIDPYIVVGPGFTYRTGTADPYVMTANVGGGVNLWFVDWMGMRLAGLAKIGAVPVFFNSSNNYLQFNAGIVFRTPDQTTTKYNDQKRHKWATKRSKKYKKKGGQ